MSIGGLDFSGCLKSLVLNDAAWERGLCPTSGTLLLVAGSAPETLDDLDNPRFYRGQSVIVEVEGERHPRGALRIITATYNGGELALEVGCLLSLLSYRQPTNPDTAGVSLGTATSLLTVATNLLNAAGITAIAITGASDTTIHYPPSVSGSYISSAAEILYSLGNVGWVDNQEVLQICAVDPQPTSADTTMLVGVDCKDPVRNRGLELPPEEVVATGQSVIVKTRTTPYQLDKSTEYVDASTLHPERTGITPVRVVTITESQDGPVVTRTTSEDLARGLIGQGLDLDAGGITTLIANAQKQEEVYTFEPGAEGRLLKYQRRIYRANGLAIPTWFSWHKQNGTEPYWQDGDGNPGIGQLQVTTGSVLAERETKTYVYTDGIPSKVTTTLELCEGEVLGDIDVDWEEWLGIYGLPTTLKTDTVTTEEWIELRPGTWQKITSVQRAAGRQQPQRFEELDDEDPLAYIAAFGTALGAIATTTELSNSGQLNPPAPERRPPTHFQETNQGSARYRFPQNGGTYQERQSTISVPYLPSETRTDKPGKRFYGSGDSARAMLERSAYLDGAVKIARAKGSRVDARLTHGLMQGYRPLMTCDVSYPGGTVRRFGVDAMTWVLTQTECLVSFNGLYWGTVQEGGVLQLPYQRVGVLAGGLRYGGRLELLPYSLEPVAIALLGGLRYGGQLSQSFNASFNLLSGYRYGGQLNAAEQNLERLRSGYLYGGNLMLSSVLTRMRGGYEYGGRLVLPGDPHYPNVSLLLPFTGSDGSTTFVDDSPNNFTGTATNAVISTAQFKFGGSSGYFNGASRVVFPYSSAFEFPGDYTIELFAYPISLPEEAVLITNYAGSANGFSLQLDTSRRAFFNLTGDGIDIQGTTQMSLNSWNHIAVTRSGSTNRLFVNGNLEASLNNNVSITGADLYLGTIYVPGFGFFNNYLGYLDEVRITKGVARYTASFTPPTEPFPDS